MLRLASLQTDKNLQTDYDRYTLEFRIITDIRTLLIKTCENPKLYRALRKCTYDPKVVDQFLLYFPYEILFVAVLLFVVEKFFSKMFEVQDEAENFYDLFVKMSVLKGKKDEETSSKLIKPSVEVN